MGPDTRTNCQSVDTSDEKIGNPNQRPRFTGALNTLTWVFTVFCTVAQRIKFRSSFDLGLLLRRRGSTALRSASTPLSATMLSRLSIKSGRQARWGFVRDGSWISPDACASVILIRIAHIYGGRSMNDKFAKPAIELVTLKQLCVELKVDPRGAREASPSRA